MKIKAELFSNSTEEKNSLLEDAILPVLQNYYNVVIREWQDDCAWPEIFVPQD